MRPILKTLTATALAIGTIGSVLVVSTAGPAHAATPVAVRRTSWDRRVTIRSRTTCQQHSANERWFDVVYPQFAEDRQNAYIEAFECHHGFSGGWGYRTTVEYEHWGRYRDSRWSNSFHYLRVYSTRHRSGASGTRQLCGTAYFESPLRGYVTDWFIETSNPDPVVLTANVVCPNGERITVDASARERWGVII